MAFDTVNIGAQANDGTGDPLRTAFDIINSSLIYLKDQYDLVSWDIANITHHGELSDLLDDHHTQYFNQTRGDARYSQLGHTHAFSSLTSIPTTVAGYGILDVFTKTDGDLRYAYKLHNHSWSQLFDVPTTLFGYGISDAYTKLHIDNNIYTKTQIDNNFATLANVTQLEDMIFDTDNYFDPGNIRPFSIETSMLHVGVKSQQFLLSGIILEANYTGLVSSFNYTTGDVIHLSMDDGTGTETIRTWNVVGNTITGLVDAQAYYIYAKCIRVGVSADIVLDTVQRTTESDATYYYFMIGVLHSVVNSVRAISATYGFTTINGKFITTGRITSSDGLTYFDLDMGVIRGAIVFSDGTTGENLIATASQAAADAEEALLGVAAVAPSEEGLELRYSFDQDGYVQIGDESKNRYSGTLAGTKGTNWDWEQGVKGRGYKVITAASSSILVTSDGTGKFDKQSFTIAGWVKIHTKPSANGYFPIFSYDYTAHSTPYYAGHFRMEYISSGDTVRVGLGFNTSGTLQFVQKILIPWADIGTNWHHVAVTFTSGAQKIYLDGVEVATGTIAGTITYYTQEVWVAGMNSGTTIHPATYDDIRYYSRVLAPEEILGLVKGLGNASSKTVIDGGIVTTGNLILQGSDGLQKAGMTAEGSDSAVRIWAGDSYANRASAPFRVTQAGALTATQGSIAGWSLTDVGGTTRLSKSNDAGTLDIFAIDADNKSIVIYDSSGVEKLSMRGQNIIPLASLVAAGTSSGNFANDDGVFTSVGSTVVTMASTITPTYDGTALFRVSVAYTKSDLATSVSANVSIQVDLYNSTGTTFVKTIGTIYRVFLGTTSATLRSAFGILPAGAAGTTYTVKYTVTFADSSVDSSNVNQVGTLTVDYNNPLSNTSYLLTYTNTSTQLGLDGMFSYWTSSKYYYLSATASTHFLEARGGLKWITPGSTSVYLEIISSEMRLVGIGTSTYSNLARVYVDNTSGRLFKRSTLGE